VYDGSGRRHTVTVREGDLFGVLLAGDLNPALRALLPAAVRSALRGDASPLLRLNLLAEGLIPSVPLPPPAEGVEGIDNALNATTICEEAPFPWGHADPPSARPGEVSGALAALPSASFYPFDAQTALAAGTIPGCLDWPYGSPAPAAVGALPNVPALILSGEQDLRTPTSQALAVAAQIPDAQVLTVPFTGHSVLGTDFSGCAQAAVRAFFTGASVQPCGAVPDIFTPTPITPTHLGALSPAGGVPGRAGRTVTAVLDTILDLNRQVIGATLQANQALPNGSSFGGLRGGYARLSSTTLRLHRFSFVSGVELSGALPVRHGKLQTATIHIGGFAAAGGSIRVGVGAGAALTGTLGGRHVRVEVGKVKLSRAGAGGEWPAHAPAFPLGGLARLP
jgi:hypothetical protein